MRLFFFLRVAIVLMAIIPAPLQLARGCDEIPIPDVPQAINQLRSIEAFRHIDPELHLKVQAQKRQGPELNASFSIRNAKGEPVIGALVAVVESARDRLQRGFYDLPIDNLPLALAVTDREGRVAFEHLKRSHNHYAAEWSVPRAFLLVFHAEYAWKLHRLEHHDNQQQADITLEAPMTLHGTLKAEEKPVHNALMSVFEYWFHKPRFVDAALAELWECPLLPRARSDAEGKFQITNMPHGWANWKVQHHLYDQDYSLTKISFTRLGDPLDLNLVPKPLQPIPARLIEDANGQPLGGFSLPRRTEPAWVDEQGNFELNEVIRMGEKGISFSVSPPLPFVGQSVRTQTPADSERLEIRIRRGTVVRGRVEDETSKQGIPGLLIVATPSPQAPTEGSSNKERNDSQATDEPQTSMIDVSLTVTDDNGDYTIALPSGKVRLSLVTKVSGYECQSDFDGGRSTHGILSQGETWGVEIDASDPSQIDSHSLFPPAMARLRRITPIHGKVVDERGMPIAGAKIVVEAMMLGWHSVATSANDGTYSVMPPSGATGSVKVTAQYRESTTVERVDIDPRGSYSDKPLMLTLDASASHTTIGGAVLLDGAGCEGILMAAYAISDTAGGIQFDSMNAIGWAWTNADGRYLIEVNEPVVNQYTMRIIGPESFQNSTFPILKLASGHNEVDSFAFANKYGNRSLHGEILDLNGDPVAGARIMAITERNKEQLLRDSGSDAERDTTGTTDATGKFECKNLGFGTLRLQIHARDFGDYWASATNTIIQNVSIDKPIIALLDPRLADPPSLVEPIETRDAPELDDNPSAWQLSRGPTIRGKVVADEKKPVANATIQVFATKPLQAPPTILPLAHSWNGLQTQTNEKGEYALQLPDDGYQVRLLAIRPGYTGQLSSYLDPSQEKQWDAILQSRPEVDPETRFQTRVLDADQRPIPQALVISTRTGDQVGLADEVGIGGPIVIRWTDHQGYAGPGIGPRDNWKLIHHRGSGMRYADPTGIESEALERGFSLVGRIVDELQNPIANYPVCVSAMYRRLTFRVVTDSQGYFRFDDIAFLGKRFGGEILLYGDIQAQDPRGWLATRRIAIPAPGKLLQLPSFSLRKSPSVRIHLIDPAGNPIEAPFDCRFQLRQTSLELSKQKLESGMLIKHLPAEPLLISPRINGYRVVHTEPTMQSTGWEPFISFGWLLEEDCDLTLTVVP